ncbi:hypothetical protein [Chloroflexus aurantiacus]
MGITCVATVRLEVASLQELAATQMVHTVTAHGVVRGVVLFILAVSLPGLLTA